jgi:hypothetical protein
LDGLGARRTLCWRMAVSRAALLLAAVLLATGCSESPPAVSPPVPPQLAPADGFDAGVFTLGVLIDLTGPASEADRAALVGIQAYWAGVNARGGVAQLYPVELSVKDGGAAASPGGDAALLGDAAAVGDGGAAASPGGDAAPPRDGDVAVGEWDIAALAYVSTGIDAASPADAASAANTASKIDAPDATGPSSALAGLPFPVVPAVATLAGEDLDWVLTSATPVELTTVALLDRFRASGPGAAWCVIVDSTPLGRRVAAAAYAAGAARETAPAMLDLDVGEIEVLDLDASVFDVYDAVSDRQCRYVLVETAEPSAISVLGQLPPNLTVVRRSTLAAGHELPEHVELFVDAAPPWLTGRSAVMDAFVADWGRFHSGTAPEPVALPSSSALSERGTEHGTAGVSLTQAVSFAQPDGRPVADPRTRAGWLSQLRLHLLLEQAVAAGDVSRERLIALAPRVEPVDPDRNTLPGVRRIGMDISEPIGGGPLRTLRLYGRSDVTADELGLRQVLVLDVTHLVDELRDGLAAERLRG